MLGVRPPHFNSIYRCFASPTKVICIHQLHVALIVVQTCMSHKTLLCGCCVVVVAYVILFGSSRRQCWGYVLPISTAYTGASLHQQKSFAYINCMLPLLLYKLVCLIIFVAHFGSHFSPRSPGITSHNPCIFCSTETIQQPNVAKKVFM